MKLSELIENAEKALKEQGDIPVVVPDVGCGCCRDYRFQQPVTEVCTEVKAHDDSWNDIEYPAAFIVS
ncbi:hypothetical protein [Streptomyces sp. NPDC048489]|uniref:hypothetical protein n=1 Tax=Streptomyces sp. NPDC048489 TaxID=3154504 RepID=UPI0034206814